MEITMLAQTLVTCLTPFLPTLLGFGAKVSEEIAKGVGDDAWAEAKSLWARLHPHAAPGSPLLTAATDVAKNPDDDIYRTVLGRKLEELLTQNPNLAEQLSSLTQTPGVQRIVAEEATVRQAKQSITGKGGGTQEIIAHKNALIEGVEQNIRGGD